MSPTWSSTRTISKSSQSSPWPDVELEKRITKRDMSRTPDFDSVEELPPPVLAKTKTKSVAGSTSTKQKKSARIEGVPGGLHVHWARLRRRLGTGTSPSTSDSLLDESAGGDSSTTRHPHLSERYEDGDEVDEVIVDRSWSEELKGSVSVSEQDGSPKKSDSHAVGGTATDHESLAIHADGFWALCTPLIILRWRVWPFIVDFFSLRFFDDKAEQHYIKEHWFMRKALALWASVFLVINWVLSTIFVPGPRVLADEIFFYGVAPALTFPIIFMIMWDFPRDRPTLYQVFLNISIWSWPIYQVLFIFLCGFYTHPNFKPGWLFSCGNRDFLATFYYAVSMPTIGLFGLRLKRFPAFIGTLVWAGFVIGTILPFRTGWTRNLLNFIVFQFFLIYLHFMLEQSERRLYTLRDQLKIQFRATQKAQVNERKAGDSKRRLTSYVFHEVRVPLNTALLALQNIQAANAVAPEQEIEFKALEGSLSMMSKVLNDVLDFNRMDSGRFESVSRPYTFHQVMRGLFVPLRLAADARGLDFITDLDVRIDRVARFSALTAKGLKHEEVLRELEAAPDADGILVGDETRLMQIVTNLASNACKFTPPGGQLRVATKLIVPSNVWTPRTESEKLECGNGVLGVDSGADESGEKMERVRPGEGELSATSLSMHNLRHSKPPEVVVVRIEVQDTGYGIPPKEMEQSKLFSAFNQTEQGKQQGGKGTGLGLALVRQIVKRSGGRLGVISKVGRGSTFWVELPLGVGPKALAQPNAHELANRDVSKTVAEDPMSRQMNDAGAMRRATDVRQQDSMGTDRSSNKKARPTSVMHNIMDQGGLVELAAKSGDNGNGSVITRTMADTLLPSTAHLEDTLSFPKSSTPTSIPEHATTPSSENAPSLASSGAPTRIELPPPLFDPMVARPLDSNTSSYNGSATTAVNTPMSTSLATPPPNIRKISEPTPATDTRPPPQPTSTVASAPTPTKPTKDKDNMSIPPGLDVLVVDDDPLTRMLMTRLLTRLGCKVATAENGELALEMILGPLARPSPASEQPSIKFADEATATRSDNSHSQNQRPPSLIQQHQQQLQNVQNKYAIVFLDNQMPVLSGISTVARLRELGRRDFVVGVTGNALLSDQEEYLEAGVDHVLTKPVLERSLKSMLVLAAERRQPSSEREALPDPPPSS